MTIAAAESVRSAPSMLFATKYNNLRKADKKMLRHAFRTEIAWYQITIKRKAARNLRRHGEKIFGCPLLAPDQRFKNCAAAKRGELVEAAAVAAKIPERSLIAAANSLGGRTPARAVELLPGA